MTLRQKIFDRKTWYAPQRAPLCDPKNFSTTVFLWNTEVFPYEVFRYFETTNSQMKSWFSPLKHKFFRYQNFSKTQKASSANFFQNCETTNFWQKIAILPSPFLSIKTFDTRIFLKHRRVPLPSFFVLWDNKFSIEDRVIPLWGKKFDNRIFLKHRRFLLLNFSVLWDNKYSNEGRVIPLWCKKIDNRIFLKHGRLLLPSFSTLWDNKLLNEDRDNSLWRKKNSIPEIF